MKKIQWFKDNKDKFSLELNGYSEPPVGPYISTLPLVNKNGKIIDLGCGNGMLLKFLIEFSNQQLIPYGIDLNQLSLNKAKEFFPNQKDNFKIFDVNKYNFEEGPFDIIITNPFYTKPNIRQFTEKCLQNLNPGGRIIYRIHDDVILKNNITDLRELTDFKDQPIEILKGNGLTIIVIDKGDNNT